MSDELPPLRTDPWPWVDRLSNGWLDLSFDAPMLTDHRVDWLKARDWLAAEYAAVFAPVLLDPITGSWFVNFKAVCRSESVAATLYREDFPDDLCLAAKHTESEILIHDVAERLRATKPDLGSLETMDKAAFRAWVGTQWFD